MHRHLTRVVFIFVGGLGLAAGLRVTLAAQAATSDVLPALMTEVRALRLAMEQMAAVTPRVQLAMGRLQLQEQRVNTLQRRQQEIHSGLTGTESSLEEQRRLLIQLEAAAAQETNRPPTEKSAADDQMKNIRSQIAGMESVVQQLRAEEATVAADLATEQARWNEINQRLEELDRALARR